MPDRPAIPAGERGRRAIRSRAGRSLASPIRRGAVRGEDGRLAVMRQERRSRRSSASARTRRRPLAGLVARESETAPAQSGPFGSAADRARRPGARR